MKKTRAELKTGLGSRPGYAILVLTGWELESVEIGAQAQLCIQRNQDQRYLGDAQQWTGTQTWHHVSLSDETVPDAIVLAIEPALVDPLVENPQMTYQVQIRIGQEQGIGVIRIREGVLSSLASGQSVSPVSHVASAAAVLTPVSEVIAVEPIQVEETTPTQPPKKSKVLPIILGIALLVLVLAAYFIWSALKKQSPVTTATVTAPAEAPTTPPAALPCSLESLTQTKDDLVFIQTCLKSEPDSAKILAVIGTAKQNNRCELAQRLYAFKGQSGDSVVALAYAKEFDPATFVQGCLTAADKETAIYWYDIVLSKDPNNAEAKARLDALRK